MIELPTFWEFMRGAFLFSAGISGACVAFIFGFAIICGPAFAAFKHFEHKYGAKEPKP